MEMKGDTFLGTKKKGPSLVLHENYFFLTNFNPKCVFLENEQINFSSC